MLWFIVVHPRPYQTADYFGGSCRAVSGNPIRLSTRRALTTFNGVGKALSAVTELGEDVVTKALDLLVIVVGADDVATVFVDQSDGAQALTC